MYVLDLKKVLSLEWHLITASIVAYREGVNLVIVGA